ncbi:endonuclease/exonuclease/phosphatase family metal-dependent hydrolase [Ereboglobus sp. PH5-10]|nr:endonuclease/exonuclease/phosphatase family metal-dependent hydrolase [Ereboglobus sp. PH5-10]
MREQTTHMRINIIFRIGLVLALAIGVASTAPAETPLRVVSYNIHAGRGMDKQLDLTRIAGVLRRLNADAILLQEVDVLTKRSGGVDQAAELGRMLGMHSYFARAMSYGGGEYGNAVLSKLPFAHTSTLSLAGGVEPRSAGIVEIVVPRSGAKDASAAHNGHRVMLVSVHLDHKKKETQMEHAKQISEEVERLMEKNSSAVAIWGGDFNARETSPIWDVVRKQHNWLMPQKHETAKATFPSHNPKSEIDWFLYRTRGTKTPAPEVREYKAIPEPVASDHCPVVFAVELRAGR